MLSEQQDQLFMQKALEQAQLAFEADEVPVGAVLVKDAEIIGSGFNQTITLSDPTAHAEVMALRHAGRTLNNYRLVDTTLYVTLEPCQMCTGALIHSRIKRLVFAAHDPKTGVIESVDNMLSKPFHNHIIEHTTGILADESKALLQEFFRIKREKKKS